MRSFYLVKEVKGIEYKAVFWTIKKRGIITEKNSEV